MPTKIFTVLGGTCPFGRGCEIDSPSCRKCEYFYRTGTATFFWCNHPPKPSESMPQSRKRGRPAKKAEKCPVNGRKKKNG